MVTAVKFKLEAQQLRLSDSSSVHAVAERSVQSIVSSILLQKIIEIHEPEISLDGVATEIAASFSTEEGAGMLQKSVRGLQSTGAMSSTFDVYICTRDGADSQVAGQICELLEAEHLRVFWSEKDLPATGLSMQEWEEHALSAINKSTLFSPIMSKVALAPLASQRESSPVDPLLLQYQIALQLMKDSSCPLQALPTTHYLHLLTYPPVSLTHS